MMWDMILPFIEGEAHKLGPIMAQQEKEFGATDLAYVITKAQDMRDEAPDENGIMAPNLNKGNYRVFLAYMNRKKVEREGQIYFEMEYVRDKEGKIILTGLEGLIKMIAGGSL